MWAVLVQARIQARALHPARQAEVEEQERRAAERWERWRQLREQRQRDG